MPSIQEVLDSALKYGFEYAIIFTDQNGNVKMAVGLNGFTKKIADTINSYVTLLNNFGIKFNTQVYDVRSKKEISLFDIPMFFSIDENMIQSNFRQGGYM